MARERVRQTLPGAAVPDHATNISFLLALSGCASQKYYAHLWCKQTTAKSAEIGIYTRWDGKLIVKTYDSQCEYIRFEGVEVEKE